MSIKYILLVGLGSFIGGILRFGLSFWMKQQVSIFPFSLFLGTFLVNIIGCFCIGFLYGIAQKNLLAMPWILFGCVGILGGFTTFSAFSYETITMIMGKHIFQAIAYVMSSVLIGLLCTYAGFWIVKQ